MLYMLDSDTCVELFRRRSRALIRRFERLSVEETCISIVTYAELRFGADKSTQKSLNHEILEEFTSRTSVLPWDKRAAVLYSRARLVLERGGNPIGPLDTMIAAHALSLDATIVTNNVRHFERVPDLKVENWLVDDQ